MANPGASFEEIMEAAKAANAHNFIVGKSDGYDTQVGERGGAIYREAKNNASRLLVLSSTTLKFSSLMKRLHRWMWRRRSRFRKPSLG